jgi:hypothetical protein
MSYTKRQFVEAAFEELGMAAYTFDLTPEMLQSAVRRMDAMVADWNGRGIRLAYPLPMSPDNANLDSQTEVPDAANEAIIANLAIELGPSYGKQTNPVTMITARNGYNTLLAKAAMPEEQNLPSMPSGAGNKTWDDPFTEEPQPAVKVGQDGSLQF